jgi:hypothetical protein
VTLLGCAVLLVSMLPALVARRRLERTGRGLEAEIRLMEEATQRIARDRRALLTDPYVVERAMRELLEPGPRVAAPRPPPATPAPAAPTAPAARAPRTPPGEPPR